MARPKMEMQTKEQGFEIVCQMIEKGLSLNTILNSPDKPISRTVFYELLNLDAKFNERYARAREIFADSVFEEILDIADNSNADLELVDGKIVINGEAVQRSRLKIDARKWMLSKLNPKKYGDKLEVDGKFSGNIVLQVPAEGDGLGE